MDTKGLAFPKPKDQDNKSRGIKRFYRMKNKSSKRAKACDISKAVRKKSFSKRQRLLCSMWTTWDSKQSFY
ncbi:MAG: hypothetical protein ACI4ON_00325 [Clostridia bacterium]